MVANTSSPVINIMDEKKPISGRGYRPCFNHVLLNIQSPNEINQWLTLLKIRSYAHLDYATKFFKRKAQCTSSSMLIDTRFN